MTLIKDRFLLSKGAAPLLLLAQAATARVTDANSIFLSTLDIGGLERLFLADLIMGPRVHLKATFTFRQHLLLNHAEIGHWTVKFSMGLTVQYITHGEDLLRGNAPRRSLLMGLPLVGPHRLIVTKIILLLLVLGLTEAQPVLNKHIYQLTMPLVVTIIFPLK